MMCENVKQGIQTILNNLFQEVKEIPMMDGDGLGKQL